MLLLMIALSLLFCPFASAAPSHSKKIIVIGAGLSGLTAAHRLQQQGYDVEVFEARERVGGRVFSVYQNGNIIELGAKNLYDGGEAQHVVALIKEFGLQTNKTQFVRKNNYYDGERIIALSGSLHGYFKDLEEVKSSLIKASVHAKNMEEILQAIFSEHPTLLQFYRTLLSVYEGGPSDQLSTYYAETLYHMLLGGLSAAHPGSEEEITYIDYLDIVGGNSLLPEKLAEKLGSKLHLGTPLRSMHKTVHGDYQLRFEGGKTVQADLVVMAIPCSVYGDIEIDEQVIPKERLNAIQAVRYGTNSKIIMHIDAPMKSETVLNERILASYNEQNGNTLTLFFVGNQGNFDASTINQVLKREQPFLNAVFGLTFLPPATIAKGYSFESYTGPIGYSWFNDPYARGSYSFIAPGQEKFTQIGIYNGEPIRTLFTPIDDRLYFVGEHTTPDLKLGGTVEAAVESGERITRLIIKGK